MVRILPALALLVVTNLETLQAKPPELPAKPKDDCIIPAVFDPHEWNEPFAVTPFRFPMEQVPQPEKVCMPAEVEILIVPPHEILLASSQFRVPDLPAVDAGLVLALEKVEEEAKAVQSHGIVAEIAVITSSSEFAGEGKRLWQTVLQQVHAMTGLDLNVSLSGEFRLRISALGHRSEFRVHVPAREH